MSEVNNSIARLIAFYLPQYYPIPENDKWWGTGFTEWTNVAKARPLFREHLQPKLPADLGFYDLRVPEVRQLQAELAHNAGIEGFCYWHYWFGNGKLLLDRPLKEVVSLKEPVFPFCVAWANESWTGRWHGLDSTVIQNQYYPGDNDTREHFYYLLNYFSDDRYIQMDSKPLLLIYHPELIPEANRMMSILRELAEKSGLGGLYILGFTDTRVFLPDRYGLDGLVYSGFNKAYEKSKMPLTGLNFERNVNRFKYLINRYPINTFSYERASKAWLDYEDFEFEYYPTVFPNWDNSPRCGKRAVIITQSTPELFEDHLSKAIDKVSNRQNDKKLVFIKSWNEWAEGNYLEPDRLYGHEYLHAIKRVMDLK